MSIVIPYTYCTSVIVMCWWIILSSSNMVWRILLQITVYIFIGSFWSSSCGLLFVRASIIGQGKYYAHPHMYLKCITKLKFMLWSMYIYQYMFHYKFLSFYIVHAGITFVIQVCVEYIASYYVCLYVQLWYFQLAVRNIIMVITSSFSIFYNYIIYVYTCCYIFLFSWWIHKISQMRDTLL